MKFKVKTLFPFLAALFVFFLCSCTSDASDTTDISGETPDNSAASEPSESDLITFSGDVFSAEYAGCVSYDSIAGCFYLNLKISNTVDFECVYSLSDVYVDSTHCQSGTGVPVTTESGKNVNGAFIVFCETPLEDVETVEFKLTVRDNSNYSEIETSETITIHPNA